MQEGYSDLRVIVTGGASGLGLSIATRLLEGGAKVHVCDIAEAGLRRLDEHYTQVSTSVADVSKAEDVARLFDEAAASFGDLTGLVNNVGIAGPIGPIETLPLDAWTAAMATNLTSAMLCMQKAVPILRGNGGGSIVNMSSVAGRAAFPLRASYCSTKAGMIGLTLSTAAELGPDNIRVNAVLPGACDSDRLDRVLHARSIEENRSYDDLRREAEQICVLQRLLDPDEVAATVAFLLSPAGSGITAQAISVCGGAKI